MSESLGDIIVDGEDRLLRYGSYDYGYLADGRLEWRRDWSNHTLRCYDYDVFGALRRFREGAISSTATVSPCSEIEVQTEVVYDIDPAGRRVGRTQRGYTGGVAGPANVLRWIYADALNPVAQLDERNRITQAYVYGNYAHTPDYLVAFTYADAESTSPSSTTTYRYVYDIRGSVRLVVNASTGVIAQQLDYGPWGEVLDDSAPGFQPFGYAGGEYDATTDLVRFGARDYDAEIGRWTAKDPIGFAGGDTNLYAYVGGDPIGLVDVTGKLAWLAPVGGCLLGMGLEGLSEFFEDDQDYLCACAGGAIGGGLGAGLLKLVGATAAGAIGSAADAAFGEITDDDSGPWSIANIGLSAFLGGGMGKVLSMLGDVTHPLFPALLSFGNSTVTNAVDEFEALGEEGF